GESKGRRLRSHPSGGRSIPTATATAAISAAPTAAAPAATVAATATAAAPAATVSAAPAPLFPGLGLVDRQVPAPVVVPVEPLDGRLRLGVRAHLHEAESLRAVRVPVDDDLGALHRAELGEQRLQVGLVHVVGQVADVKLVAHRWSPGEGMATRRVLSGSR